jgi:DNA-binding IclR family transcriptional regulator
MTGRGRQDSGRQLFYVEQDNNSRYYCGSRLYQLRRRVRNELVLFEVAGQKMIRLAEMGETCHLT